ncbi:hypothetical protein KIH74_21130 [Kineosporia sp. J2-2]|uniref:Histidine kinase/HSP90-like ATPase domain-containing protein n=1 Tax=Kineosporia corallincola TaxID=2835133 RepID=A0ABS5TK19_9ACTN|nr:ATP-binding protein [Kineosporia corallincola]MBT0771454.1 hypothetical protein [Kineosporia corallincola]
MAQRTGPTGPMTTTSDPIRPRGSAAPHLLPSGQAGVHLATALCLARSVLFLRAAGLGAAAGVALATGADPLHLAVPFGLLLAVTLVELGRVRDFARETSRLAALATDLCLAVLCPVLGLTDLGLVVFQIGTAALAAALLGTAAAPVWAGQAAQLGLILWLVPHHTLDTPAPAAAVPVLLVGLVLVPAAGLLAVAVARSVRSRLNQVLDEAGEPGVRTAGLVTGLGRALRGVSPGSRLAGECAQALAHDAAGQLDEARKPVRGVRFDDPLVDLAVPLEQLCREWSSTHRIAITTRMEPLWPSGVVRHGLAVLVTESLDNIAHHARATRARLVLRGKDHDIDLSINDNGGGFTVPDGKILLAGRYPGLERMVGRARAMGATLTVSSEQYGGTTIRIRLTR